MQQADLLTLTASIVAAHVSYNRVSVEEVARLVQEVRRALATLGQLQSETKPVKVPVVSLMASVKPDHIVCMECGARRKLLRRHLLAAHGMTPKQYRADYGLAWTYPLTAPNYSDRRREMAKAAATGRTPKLRTDHADGHTRKKGLLKGIDASRSDRSRWGSIRESLHLILPGPLV